MHRFLTIALAIVATALPCASTAQTPPPEIGVVIMHGKGGSPARHVSELASALEGQGYLVANLEMPWSGRRAYDVGVDTAIKEVASALDTLRGKGARKLFVAGHSQGGLFAIYFGGRQAVDGIIAIAPGGNVGSPVYQDKVGASVDAARRLVAEGKGNEQAKLVDYEGAKGAFPVLATASAYLSWFDPNGAMNEPMAIRSMNPQTPVLYIAPTRDYPVLRRVKEQFFALLPKNPLTRLYEPDASHLDAPAASRSEIMRWTAEVGSTKAPR